MTTIRVNPPSASNGAGNLSSGAIGNIDKQIALLKDELKNLRDELAEAGQSDTIPPKDKKALIELLQAKIKLVQMQIGQLEKRKKEIEEAQKEKHKTAGQKERDKLCELLKADNTVDVYA